LKLKVEARCRTPEDNKDIKLLETIQVSDVIEQEKNVISHAINET
jgi:hypothetical protein